MKPKIALLTGGQDRHYAVGLATALASQGVALEVVGSDGIDCPEFRNSEGITFLNLRGDQSPSATPLAKARRLLIYYLKLLRYAVTARPQIFHILWNNKFELFDRTFLMVCYKVLGRTVILTAHNVNQARRDSSDSMLNRLGLKAQYRLADHIFVHTELMKEELIDDFGVRDSAITVIAYGINNAVPNTAITPIESKRRLGIEPSQKAILFFGQIAPYKGLDCLVTAFQQLLLTSSDYRLIIAGEPKKGHELYWSRISETISEDVENGFVIPRIEHIRDADAEVYFKSADVLVLPYRQIFQSGVLFFGYSFGLPVIASDVGALKEDVVEGRTGWLCTPGNPAELARAIEKHFASDLYRNLQTGRSYIREYASTRHSWRDISEKTAHVYADILVGT